MSVCVRMCVSVCVCLSVCQYIYGFVCECVSLKAGAWAGTEKRGTSEVGGPELTHCDGSECPRHGYPAGLPRRPGADWHLEEGAWGPE